MEENSKASGKPTEQLKSHLERLKPEKKVILIIDGLDEVQLRDSSFVADVILPLQGIVNTKWLCSGRPEPELDRIFQSCHAHKYELPPMKREDIREMVLEKIGPLRNRLIKQDKDTNGSVENEFINLIEDKADGLPIYVTYVIGDILSGRYRLLDGQEDLPTSLDAYHEELIARLSIGDLVKILTPLAVLLALAKEPLTESEIVAMMRSQNLVSDEGYGVDLVKKGLSLISAMIRRAQCRDGEEGFTLFHDSLKTHILHADTLKDTVRLTRDYFTKAAVASMNDAVSSKYIFRNGISHLIEEERISESCDLLINFSYLMNRLKKQRSTESNNLVNE